MHMCMYLLGHTLTENEVRKSWAIPHPGSAQEGVCFFPWEVPWAYAKHSGSLKEADLTWDRNQDFPAAVCGVYSVTSRSTHSSPQASFCSYTQEKGSQCFLENVCHTVCSSTRESWKPAPWCFPVCLIHIWELQITQLFSLSQLLTGFFLPALKLPHSKP